MLSSGQLRKIQRRQTPLYTCKHEVETFVETFKLKTEMRYIIYEHRRYRREGGRGEGGRETERACVKVARE